MPGVEKGRGEEEWAAAAASRCRLLFYFCLCIFVGILEFRVPFFISLWKPLYVRSWGTKRFFFRKAICFVKRAPTVSRLGCKPPASIGTDPPPPS